MPNRVSTLPRSAGGLPIPYVASWEGEDEYVIRPCRWSLGKPAVFPARELVGVTRPVFGIMDPARQREVVADVRCQVCHFKLPAIDVDRVDDQPFNWLVDLTHEPRTMRGHRLVLEPWVCDECLPYALQVCPGLLGRGRLRYVLAVFTAQMVAVTIKPHGNLEGKPACGGYHKIEPLSFHRLEAQLVLERGVEKLRELLMNDPPA